MLIPKNVAKSMVSFASSDASRYTLVGVSVKRTGCPDASCEAVASDGKVLARARWTDNPQEYPSIPGMADIQAVDGFTTIIPADALADMAKSAPKPRKNGMLPVLQNVAIQEAGSNGRIQMATTDLESPSLRTVATVEGTYPKYDNAIPTGSPALRIRFDVRILSAALKAMSGMVSSEQVDICIWEPDRPIMVEGKMDDGGRIDVLVMPIAIR